MNATNKSKSNDELQKCIALLAAEFSTSTGVRAMAVVAGIAEGMTDDDKLYFYVQGLIGYDANQEGYIDSYVLDEEGYLIEPEDGKPFFGYGMSLSSHEAYLALYQYFGERWIERALMAHCMGLPGEAPRSAAVKVDAWIDAAKQRYVEASRCHHRSQEAELTEGLRRAWERFAGAMKIVAPDCAQFAAA